MDTPLENQVIDAQNQTKSVNRAINKFKPKTFSQRFKNAKSWAFWCSFLPALWSFAGEFLLFHIALSASSSLHIALVAFFAFVGASAIELLKRFFLNELLISALSRKYDLIFFVLLVLSLAVVAGSYLCSTTGVSRFNNEELAITHTGVRTDSIAKYYDQLIYTLDTTHTSYINSVKWGNKVNIENSATKLEASNYSTNRTNLLSAKQKAIDRANSKNDVGEKKADNKTNANGQIYYIITASCEALILLLLFAVQYYDFMVAKEHDAKNFMLYHQPVNITIGQVNELVTELVQRTLATTRTSPPPSVDESESKRTTSTISSDTKELLEPNNQDSTNKDDSTSTTAVDMPKPSIEVKELLELPTDTKELNQDSISTESDNDDMIVNNCLIKYQQAPARFTRDFLEVYRPVIFDILRGATWENVSENLRVKGKVYELGDMRTTRPKEEVEERTISKTFFYELKKFITENSQQLNR